MGYRVVVRLGPKVDKHAADTLEAALELLERSARAAAAGPRRETLDLHVRRYEPAHQVAARAELRGAGVRAGIDVRGDGSAEAWTGRLRRRVVEARGGEDAYAALRRVVQSTCVLPLGRSQPACSRQSGERDSSSAQKRGEWSITSRWQTSCSIT
jgi:hypothetical protein